MGLDGAENRDAFVQQATISESETQSVFLMRQAEATLGFHQNVAAITRLDREGGLVTVTTVDTRAVSIVPADHLIWSAGANAIADQEVAEGLSRELWLTGSISDRARAEFEQRGWSVMANERERLAPDLDSGLAEETMSEDQESVD
jgi:hypothetical protein